MRHVSRRSFAGLTAGAAATGWTRRARSQSQTDVIVVGAGLSGLNAALILEDLGFNVVVLEARNRVGGRVHTLTDRPQMPESGGSEIGPMYARVMTAVQQFGLELEPWQITGLEFMLHIAGNPLASSDWSTSEANRLPEAARQLPPFALSRVYMPRDTGLPELDSWLDPIHHDRDKSLWEHYSDGGANPDALRYLRLAAQADSLHDESFLWNLRKARVSAFELTGEPFNLVVGGMSRVPESMAAALKGDLRLNTPVAGLSQDANGVTVKTESGETLSARYAVISVPLTVLRTMALDPALPPLQAEAVRTIPYGQATSVFLEVKEPFWEVDGLGSSFWSDGPIGRAYNWGTPNGRYIWVFLAGVVNYALRSWPDDDVMAFVLRELAVMRPSTVGRVSPIGVRNWSRDPYTQGTYSYRAPGQIARFGNVVAEPHGRIHFAGEHSALLQQGLEGAMESGERAAFEVFDRA